MRLLDGAVKIVHDEHLIFHIDLELTFQIILTNLVGLFFLPLILVRIKMVCRYCRCGIGMERSA